MRHSHVCAPPPPTFPLPISLWLLINPSPPIAKINIIKQTNKVNIQTSEKDKQTKKRTKKNKQTNKQTKMTKEGKNIQTNLKKEKKTRHHLLHSLSVFLDKSSLVWWDLKNWLSYRLTFVQHTFEIIVRLHKLFSAVYIWEEILNGSKMS